MADMAHKATASPSSPLFLWRLFHGLGCVSVCESPLDTKLLILQRFARMIGYGGTSIILVSYLSAIGISDSRIGLFMALTLAGDAIISLVLSLITDTCGRRRMLGLGSALMSVSGFVFATSDNFWILLVAATVGIISPSGNEIGPFRSIEESTLSHLTPSEARGNIFAWYAMTGTIGLAFGSVICGWLETSLEVAEHWGHVDALRAIFLVYGAIGLFNLILTAFLSRKCELDSGPAPSSRGTTPLLSSQKEAKKPWVPRISRERRHICVKLALLFGFDAFACNLATVSWISDYFHHKFFLISGDLGTLFFTTAVISTLSILVAARIARRFGNLNTMVYTHFPSVIALTFLGFPNTPSLAIALLIFRSCTQYIETAPRSAFIADILLPSERTAVIGIMNMVKTVATSFGPLIIGVLVQRRLNWVAFMTAGALQVVYNFCLLGVFYGERNKGRHSPPEERGEARLDHMY